MSKEIESWHSFYSKKQRSRDLTRTHLTFYRRFKQLLWNEFEKSKFLEISRIIESLNSCIHIETSACKSQISILLNSKKETLKVKIHRKDEKIEFDNIFEQKLDDAVNSAAEMFKIILDAEKEARL